MKSPLERAAQAVRAEMAVQQPDGSYVIETPPYDEAFFQDIARAVLQAIREPSDAMCEAAEYPNDYQGFERVTWRAMIDSALEEG